MRKKIAKTEKTTTPIVPSENADPHAITRIEYDALQVAFEFFNTKLFSDNPLPNVAIVLECRAHSAGSFAPNRFAYRGGSGGHEHKLSLNPDSFTNKSDEFACQTLVHEMHHLWELCYQPPRARFNYHGKGFAARMELSGLITSSTGMPGGSRTGVRMSDYVIPGGLFQQAFEALAASGWALHLESAICPGAAPKQPSKIKFTCPQCALNMWGKPDSKDICGGCNVWRKPEIADAVAVGKPELRWLHRDGAL